MFLLRRSPALRVALVGSVLGLFALAQAKRPVSHTDFDAFRSISGQALSRDGRFLAYGYMPQDADGELIVARNWPRAGRTASMWAPCRSHP